MTTVFDVPPEPLIQALAAKLKGRSEIQAPDWAAFAKTGIHTEKAPYQKDWWQTRAAAVLRRIYMDGPVGVERLRADYGGRRDRGAKPYRAVRGSGSIARDVVQQLERAGLVQTAKGKGRSVTPAGQKLCDEAAHEVKQKLQHEIPALAKY